VSSLGACGADGGSSLPRSELSERNREAKVAFRELELTLRAAVARAAVAVPESEAHRLESVARPDLLLLALLRELSGGLKLPDERGAVERFSQQRLEAVLERDFPGRRARERDRLDLRALAVALPCCRLVTCDAFIAERVRVKRSMRFRCELLPAAAQT
jgi:hypothetical protein